MDTSLLRCFGMVMLLSIGTQLYAGTNENLVEKHDTQVGVVKRDKPPAKSASEAVTAAFAFLATTMPLDQPLIVRVRESRGIFMVDVFKLSEKKETQSSDADTDDKQKIVTVKLAGDDLSMQKGAIAPGKIDSSFAQSSVVAALTFIHMNGGLPQDFEIKAKVQNNGECDVDVEWLPRMPGGFTSITVTPSSLRLYRGQ
jgi:hypothetical protein